MEFAFTAEEQAFRDEVRRFVDEHPADRYPLDGMDAGYGSGAHSRAFMAELGRRGWLGMTWPRALGGAERPMFFKLVLFEELAAAGAPFGPLAGSWQTADAMLDHLRTALPRDLQPVRHVRIPRGWSRWAGWVVAALVVVGYALSELQNARTRRASGLYAKPIVVTALQTVGLAAVTFAAVWYVNKDRGVPKVTVILLALLVVWSFIASRTRFGRHVYAVGGSAEASRRAGIAVDRVRIAVFMISGFMAGVGGIMLASRLRSVATNTGGGNLLLLVIASAVIGGTSLFGGVGRVVSALLGALVIASIQNGMDLLGLASGTKFVITGLVLLAAVLVDAYAKRRRTARGVV